MGGAKLVGIENSGYNLDSSKKENLSKLSKEELINIILLKNDIQIPVQIFSSEIAPLEALVRYLVEIKKLSISVISQRLNRNFKTIWTTYNNSKKRKIESIPISKSNSSDYFISDDSLNYIIPLMVFSKKNLSILESLIKYLHENYNLEFYKISELLHKDNRTVWTCYNRSRIKLHLKNSTNNFTKKNNIRNNLEE